MKRRTALIAGVVVLCALAGSVLLSPSRRNEVLLKLQGKQTTQDVLVLLGDTARERLFVHFEAAGAAWPPRNTAFLAFKEERQLEVWAESAEREGERVFVREYPILGASGTPGPKLREGDLQVPEGVYGLCGLNPNSAFHLSLKVDYPNGFDRRQAAAEGRTEQGGDIFIHGGSASVGCLAMGDEAIEELFVLAAEAGPETIAVIIAPCDFRLGRPFPDVPGVPWARELYSGIADALDPFRRTGPAGP